MMMQELTSTRTVSADPRSDSPMTEHILGGAVVDLEDE